jgi:hypothetical protein
MQSSGSSRWEDTEEEVGRAYACDATLAGELSGACNGAWGLGAGVTVMKTQLWFSFFQE